MKQIMMRRIFGPMVCGRAIYGLALMCSAAVPVCWASVPGSSETSVLTTAEIARYLHSQGIDVQPAKIGLPTAAIYIRGEHSALRLVEAGKGATGGARLKIACASGSQCPPFWIEVPAAAVAHPRTNALELSESRAEVASDTRVRPGQVAHLLLQDAHTRINLPVIVLDSGSVGTEVRASSVDRKKMFQARVVDAGTLRGDIQ